MPTPDHRDGAVERLWPYDGPHTPDTVTSATSAVAALARYLANASSAEALPDAPAVYTVVGELATTASRLDQVLCQLSHRAAGLGGDPGLRHDQNRGDPEATATLAALQLSEAVGAARVLSGVLNAAHEHLGHLYHEPRQD